MGVSPATSPHYWLGADLYRPLTPGRHPAILSPHGHWKEGRAEQTETGNIPARAVMLARMGFVVLNYDMVGYNDTKQTPHAFGAASEQRWNSIRATDSIQPLPDVDPARLGATGGGTQIFLLTAVNDRIKYSAPGNMISGIMQGGSPCENAPGLRIRTFNVELGALMAPRPMLMVAATGDRTHDTPRQEPPQQAHLWTLRQAVVGRIRPVQRAPQLQQRQPRTPHFRTPCRMAPNGGSRGVR